jgi:RNA polymerase sigma factor (sigma-70 family)
MNLDELVPRAVGGDRAALADVMSAIQDDVYALSLRMLWHPADAEDAAQEILVKIMTRLATFAGRSSFKTWVYRVASNHLLTTRRSRAEARQLTFADFARGLEAGLGVVAEDPEALLAVEEVKIGCTHGMLLCLDRDYRLAYVLGEIMMLSAQEIALIMGGSELAARKRLSRARQSMDRFMSDYCGLAEPSRPCRCEKQVRAARARGNIVPGEWLFAGKRRVQDLEALRIAATVFKDDPAFAAPEALAARVRALLAEHWVIRDL